MVLSGQDAWRKHPLVSGNWKRPFPGLGLAMGLFAVYLVGDYAWSSAMAPPASTHHHKPKIVFKEAGSIGDSMPTAVKRGGGH